MEPTERRVNSLSQSGKTNIPKQIGILSPSPLAACSICEEQEPTRTGALIASAIRDQEMAYAPDPSGLHMYAEQVLGLSHVSCCNMMTSILFLTRKLAFVSM